MDSKKKQKKKQKKNNNRKNKKKKKKKKEKEKEEEKYIKGETVGVKVERGVRGEGGEWCGTIPSLDKPLKQQK